MESACRRRFAVDIKRLAGPLPASSSLARLLPETLLSIPELLGLDADVNGEPEFRPKISCLPPALLPRRWPDPLSAA